MIFFPAAFILWFVSLFLFSSDSAAECVFASVIGLCELAALFLLSCACTKKRLFQVLIGFLIFVLYAAQCSALYFSGELISVLALQNANYIGFLINGKTILWICFFFVVSAVLFVTSFKIKTENRLMSSGKGRFVAGAVGLCLLLPIVSLPILRDSAPIFGIADTAMRTFFPREELPHVMDSFADNGSVKPVFSEPFPYPSSVAHPNVIVFFTEGFSKRSCTEFNDRFPNLTPNIRAFAEEACDVRCYYNHTAATFRGIQGQLCSSYPYYGGVHGWFDNAEKLLDGTKNLCSLPRILNENGYETIFFNAHLKKDPLNLMLDGLGFETVISGDESCMRYLDVPVSSISRDNAIPDEFNFKAIRMFLERRAAEEAPQPPFFLGAYNIETHAFADTKHDGVKYGNGKNISLNTIHNYDRWFGEFFKWFKSSPYRKNTILILTADHSHYYEPAVR